MKHLALTLLIVLICACESEAPSQIRFGLSSAVVTLDPRFATDATSSRLCRLIYDSLVDFDNAFQPVAGLAQWTQRSPLVYIFTLETDKYFHDGSPVTPADVVATYQSILDSQTASPHRGSLSLIKSITAVSHNQIMFELSRADPLFPGLLTIGILPKKIIESSEATELQSIVGSGQFALDGDWTDKRVILRRIRDGTKFRFETIRDPTVRALKIVNGEIDLLQGGLAPEIVAWLDTQPGVVATQHPGTTFTYMGLNLNDKYLSDPKIRQALAFAIDREQITRYLFAGRARLANSIFTPEHWAHYAAIEPTPHDPEKAKLILRELGFNAINPLRLTYKTSSDLFRLRVATVIKEQLAAVGVEVDIQSYDWGTFYGDIKAGRFQLYCLSWVGLKLPDIFRYVFHSESTPPSGANRGRYVSATMDELIERAENATSIEDRISLYHDIQSHAHADLPYVPLWYEDHVTVVRDDVLGYSVGLDGNYDALAEVQRRVH
ncbi:MAG: ABC transporter substrate-binding protein [Gammaproteobacteria bacterium]